jgi:hypothetical protein
VVEMMYQVVESCYIDRARTKDQLRTTKELNSNDVSGTEGEDVAGMQVGIRKKNHEVSV